MKTMRGQKHQNPGGHFPAEGRFGQFGLYGGAEQLLWHITPD